MKLTEEMVRQIHDVEKLQYLLIGMIQKKIEQSKKADIQKKQIKELRNKLKTATEELKVLHQKLDQIGLHQYDGAFEKIRADFNEYYFTQLFQLIQGIPFNNNNDSNSTDSQSFFPPSLISQMNSFRENFSKTSEEQLNHYENLISQKNEEIDSIKNKMEILQDQLNTAMNSPISKDIEKLITEKDSAILEMKSMLQSSVNSDKRKQQLIEEQQAEIQKLHNLLSQSSSNKASDINNSSFNSSLHSNLHNSDVAEVARLERTIADLENRINNSQASRELEIKNERLSSMIEKSNLLYADAVEEIRKLKEKYLLACDSNQLKIVNSFSFHSSSQSYDTDIMSTGIDNRNDNDNNNENFSTPLVKTSSKSKSKMKLNSTNPSDKIKMKKIKHTYRVLIASLRQTLLQFFLKDEASQISLVPVILELVGCNQQQIDTVMLKIQSSQHFVNRTGGFFGFFG